MSIPPFELNRTEKLYLPISVRCCAFPSSVVACYVDLINCVPCCFLLTSLIMFVNSSVHIAAAEERALSLDLFPVVGCTVLGRNGFPNWFLEVPRFRVFVNLSDPSQC